MGLKALTIIPMSHPGPSGRDHGEEEHDDENYGDDAIKASWGELAEALHIPDDESEDVCKKFVSFVKLVALKADEEEDNTGEEEHDEDED